MGVDADKAMRDKAVRRADDLKRLATDKKLPFKDIRGVPGEAQVEVIGNSPAEAKAIADMAIEQYTDSFKLLGADGNTSDPGLPGGLGEEAEGRHRRAGGEALRNRVDKWGVSEAEIKRIRGSDGIQIQLPGYKDPERAKKLLGRHRAARVQDGRTRRTGASPSTSTNCPRILTYAMDGALPYVCSQDRQALEKFTAGKAAAGDEFGIQKVEKMAPDEKTLPCYVPYYKTITLHAKVEVTGDQLTDARVQIDNEGGLQKPVVGFTLDKEGADKFADLTGANIGKRLAIVLDGIVDSAPRHPVAHPAAAGRSPWAASSRRRRSTRRPPTSRWCSRPARFPRPCASSRSGPWAPASGPELIQKGTYGALLGLLIVWIFMVFYYRMSGLVADVALGVNGLLLLAAMAMFGSTLTLPGIAGTVLTLGMAVDANVLINERIREEMRAGKTSRGAVDAGYDKVFWTIVDGHVTAFVAGAVLYYTGTGPVKGFAVTLMIGLAASMFTSIVVTRQIIDALVHGSSAPVRRAQAA